MTIAEIADKLGIAENTIRRYCRLFHGFLTSKQFGRATKYDTEVLEILANISTLYQEGKSTQEIQDRLKNAYTLTVDVETDKTQLGDVAAINEIREAMAKMAEHIERQDSFNQALVKELQEQRKFIEQSVRDRDEKLMTTLKLLTDARQEAAAAKEKPWWKWW